MADRVNVASNRRARHDFDLGKGFVAGMVLESLMVKAARSGKVSLAGAHVKVINGEAWLFSVTFGDTDNDSPVKLLLKASEISSINRGVLEKSMACVPTEMFFSGRWVKVELHLAKGRDKRGSRQAAMEKSSRKRNRKTMETP